MAGSIPFFTKLGTSINAFLEVVTADALKSQAHDLGGIVALALTVVIIWKGLQVVLGKMQDPLREMLWDIFTKSVVVSFCLNADGWLSLVGETMKGINEWAGGGELGLYTKLDELTEMTRTLAVYMDDQAPMGMGWFFSALPWVGFGIGIIPAFVMCLTTGLMLASLITIAPLVFFCLLFDILKEVFKSWLNLILANTIAVIFAALFLQVIINVMKKWLAALPSSGADLLLIGFMMIVLGILMSTFLAIAREISKALAAVSFESAMHSNFGKALNDTGKTAGTTAAATNIAKEGVSTGYKYLRGKLQ
ncbi:type IV secretion system protein [Sulfurospirillum sp. hDNRA2]|uniref:type IV secretion system protein n=3 Tax=Sulfurospirillum sp. hDNRA2 TaxID=3237298 RepID=UPI0020B72DDD|nr:type IV secretion system protein [Sulfurospirillum sp. DNRA8]MCP3653227.1 type IV secretion system protein [Sulfurospirillum sp. DNRA8]MCR1812078.1 type IV secretion system protein [Sulfurospirillum sp. DNRA8]